MSTNSTITVRVSETQRLSIYCHWDGYPTGVGAILKEHYNNTDKLKELMALGDLSSLGETLEESVFYGRDRGETNISVIKLSNAESVDKQDYNYYFDGENWNH